MEALWNLMFSYARCLCELVYWFTKNPGGCSACDYTSSIYKHTQKKQDMNKISEKEGETILKEKTRAWKEIKTHLFQQCFSSFL